MVADSDTESRSYKKTGPAHPRALPGLLIAHEIGPRTGDRFVVEPPFVVGRDDTCSLIIRDDRHLSGRHFQIIEVGGRWWIEDLQSRNGTHLNGDALSGKSPLDEQSLIAAGNGLFVFHNDISQMMSPPVNRFEMVGTFHLEAIVNSLRDAALSARHVLLTGPSGVGKELGAAALFRMMFPSESLAPFVVCNAARFSSEEQAVAALFGVGRNVFSSVGSRAGLIENADGGVLFLDEAHNLSAHAQRSLLRVIETGESSRIGHESELRRVSTRFILSSNAVLPTYGIAHDLFARLRHAQIPPLRERIADIPTIFSHLLNLAMDRSKSTEAARCKLLDSIDVDHYEMMCLDGFETDNVRGIIDICDRIASRLAAGASPSEAVDAVFSSRFSSSPVFCRMEGKEDAEDSETDGPINKYSEEDLEATFYKGKLYRANRELIIDIFLNRALGNISAVSRILETEHGLNTTRQTLTAYLRKWGVLKADPK